MNSLGMLRVLTLRLLTIALCLGALTPSSEAQTYSGKMRADTVYFIRGNIDYRMFSSQDDSTLMVQYYTPATETNIFLSSPNTTLKYNYINLNPGDSVSSTDGFTAPDVLPDSARVDWYTSALGTIGPDCPLFLCSACEALDPIQTLRSIAIFWKARLTGEGSPWTSMGAFSFSNASRTEDTTIALNSSTPLPNLISPNTVLNIGISPGEQINIGWSASTFAACTQTTEFDFTNIVIYSPNWSWAVPAKWHDVGYFNVDPANPNIGHFVITGNAEIGQGLTVTSSASIGGVLAVARTVQIAGGFPAIGRVLTATDALGNSSWQTPVSGGGLDSASSVVNPLYTVDLFEDFFGNPAFPSTATTQYKDWALFSSGAVSIGADTASWGNMVGVASYRSNASNIYAKIYPFAGSVTRGATFRLGTHYTRFQTHFRRFANSTSNDTLRVGLVSAEWLGTSLGGNASGRPVYGLFFEHYENSGDSLMAVAITPDTLIVVNTGIPTSDTTHTVWLENEDGTTLFYVDGVLGASISLPMAPVLLGPLVYYKAPGASFRLQTDYIWVRQTGIDRRW